MKIPRSKRGYPKTLNVKGEEWRLVFVDRIEGKDTLGMCDPSSRIIYIKNGLSSEEMFKTWLHECLHLLEAEHDIKISHRSIYQLEEAIFSFLKENF